MSVWLAIYLMAATACATEALVGDFPPPFENKIGRAVCAIIYGLVWPLALAAALARRRP